MDPKWPGTQVMSMEFGLPILFSITSRFMTSPCPLVVSAPCVFLPVYFFFILYPFVCVCV